MREAPGSPPVSGPRGLPLAKPPPQNAQKRELLHGRFTLVRIPLARPAFGTRILESFDTHPER